MAEPTGLCVRVCVCKERSLSAAIVNIEITAVKQPTTPNDQRPMWTYTATTLSPVFVISVLTVTPLLCLSRFVNSLHQCNQLVSVKQAYSSMSFRRDKFQCNIIADGPGQVNGGLYRKSFETLLLSRVKTCYPIYSLQQNPINVHINT